MSNPEYQRPLVAEVLAALRKDLPFLHIITGPRQVGKTTAAEQVSRAWGEETVFAAADAPYPPGPEWIHSQWERALAAGGGGRVLLVLDEIQKVRGWSEVVKLLWDKARRRRARIRVLLLGSSSLLIQKGMSESLAGRFLSYRCAHWGYPEMRRAFRWTLEDWIHFGGYPGAAVLKSEEPLWRRYIADSLIETVLARDVVQLATIAKPALLRHLFGMAVSHPAQIFSYNKMLGQLQDAGNTTTLAHYLRLLGTAFLLSGLEPYRPGRSRRAGSPKLVFWNNALVSAFAGGDSRSARLDTAWWGRLVENAVGAHLLNGLDLLTHRIHYWREGDDEVDFMVKTPRNLWAVEVKSGSLRRPGTGLAACMDRFPDARPLIVGAGGMPLEDFFGTDPSRIFV